MTTSSPNVLDSFLVRGFESEEEANKWHPHGISPASTQEVETAARRALNILEEETLKRQLVDAVKRDGPYNNYTAQVHRHERDPSNLDHLQTPRSDDPNFLYNLELWKERLAILWGPPRGVPASSLSLPPLFESPASSQDIAPNRESSSPSNHAPTRHALPSEQTILQRRKQIACGKATKGYRNYIRSVPLGSKEPGNPRHPVTPRAEEGTLRYFKEITYRSWRQALHQWDNPT